ncbi:MAG: DNA/RNA nuclease SfsA [Bacteriovoracaceae bacterium]|jgi:sugar fermentation stimulation protein A|nr:DNA/RNA nuclease SfsA [Bacteriovoracaceae bacterium]
MKFNNTYLGTIQNRYKRFLSDITLDNGEQTNAHVPNTGSMKTCWGENWKILVSKSDNPKRKLKYTLELTHNGDSWISVNTSVTNKLVHEALLNNKIKELKEYSNIKPEQKILDSRIDFLLTDDKENECWVEVKNVTLKGENGIALFPDSVSTRGQKHLKDLTQIVKSGKKAVMFYVINRTDVKSFSPAIEIDPTYTQLLKEAKEAGVEVLAYQTYIDENEIYIDKKIKINI